MQSCQSMISIIPQLPNPHQLLLFALKSAALFQLDKLD